jgi:hypothetical protein
LGPVPAPRKMHRGVTGPGEIVGDEQAFEHAAYYGTWEAARVVTLGLDAAQLPPCHV